MAPVFLLGSPRSGTTALAAALDAHPSLAQFYEPYFVWQRYAPGRDDDVLTADDVSARMRAYVRAEFARFQRKAGAARVVDKSPTHAFRISAIHSIFPEALFIHLVRDGRDVTASIRREWQRRLAVARSRNPLATGALASSMLRRQPFWRNRLQALAYEARFGLKGGRARTLRRIDQRHHLPWGPRFPGWQDAMAELDPIALQALQWRRSVEAAEAGLAGIPAQCQVTVFYEALVEAPEHELARIHHFLGVAPISEGGHGLAQPRRGGWRDQLGADEQARLEAAIGDKLDDLGYR